MSIVIRESRTGTVLAHGEQATDVVSYEGNLYFDPATVNRSVLDVTERRVLGVLIEKAKTTPDAYPMSLNALVTGSNQKSNRDPLLNLTDLEIEDRDLLPEAVQELAARGVSGGRQRGGRRRETLAHASEGVGDVKPRLE